MYNPYDDSFPDNNENSNFKFRKHIEKILYNIKNQTIKYKSLLYTAFFIKLLGIIIIVHNSDKITNENLHSSLSLTNYLRKFTVCYSSNISCLKLYSRFYWFICLILYIFLIAPFCLLYTIYNLDKIKTMHHCKTQVNLMHILSVIYLIIILLSQHFIEFFSLIIFSIIFQTEENDSIQLFLNNLGNLKYIVCLFNFIFILYLNMFYYHIIEFWNDPFFSKKSVIQIYQHKMFKLILTFLSNFQGLQLIIIFNNEFNSNISFIPLFLLTLTLTILFILYRKYFFPKNTLLNSLFIYVLYCEVIKCYIELYCCYTRNSKSIGFVEIFLRIFCEIMFGFLLMRIGNLLKKRNFQKNIISVLFTKQKNNNIEPYLYLINNLLDSINDTNKLDVIVSLFYRHQYQCKLLECQCKKFSFKMNHTKMEQILINNNNNRLSIEQFILLYKEVIVIIENEISTLLMFIVKENKLKNNFQILLLYIEYICYFGLNIPYGVFLIEKYFFKMGKTLPFYLEFQLYQLKKHFILKYKYKLIDQGKGIGIGIKKNKQHKIEIAKHIVDFWNFYKYQKIIFNIGNLLLTCTVAYLKILSLGKIKKNALAFFGNYYSSNNYIQQLYLEHNLGFNTIINECKEFIEKNELLIKEIAFNFTINNKLINERLCYLLTLYYFTICKRIPKIIDNLFNRNISLYQLINIGDKSFHEKKFVHPLVVSFNESRTYEICYICKYLSSKLKYNRNELVGQNFHILLPQEIRIAHQIQMKSHILFKKTLYTNKERLIIDKRGYCYPIKVQAASFPSLSYSIIIIMNITERQLYSGHNYMVLDEYGNFITYSRGIEKKFVISNEIIKKNKFTFYSYFNINENLLDSMKKQIDDENKSKDSKQKKKIFSNNNDFHDFKTKKDKTNDKEISMLYNRNRLRNSLEKIKNWIQESQSGFSFLSRIEHEENLCFAFNYKHSKLSNNLHLFKNQLMEFKFKISTIGGIKLIHVNISDDVEVNELTLSKANFRISMNNYINTVYSNQPKALYPKTITKEGQQFSSKTHLNLDKNSIYNRKPRRATVAVDNYAFFTNKSLNFRNKEAHLNSSLNSPNNLSSALQQNNVRKQSFQNDDEFGLKMVPNYFPSSNTFHVGGSTIHSMCYTNLENNNAMEKNKSSSSIQSYSKINKNLGISNFYIGNKNNLQSTLDTFIKIEDYTQSTENEFANIKRIIKSIKKHSRNKHSFFYHTFTSLLIQLTLIIICYPFIMKFTEKVSCFVSLCCSLKNIQYLINLSSNLVLDGCLFSTFFTNVSLTTSNAFVFNLLYKSNELMEQLSVFRKSLKDIEGYNIIDSYEIIDLYNSTLPSSEYIQRNSSLNEELLLFHYYLELLGRTNATRECNISSFLDDNIKPERHYQFHELLFKYITDNVITNFSKRIGEVYKKIKKGFRQILNDFIWFYILYSVCYGIVTVVIVYLLYKKFNTYIKINIDMIDLLISEKKNDEYLATKLLMFREIILNFSRKKCEDYERNLKYPKKKVKQYLDGYNKLENLNFLFSSLKVKKQKSIQETNKNKQLNNEFLYTPKNNPDHTINFNTLGNSSLYLDQNQSMHSLLNLNTINEFQVTKRKSSKKLNLLKGAKKDFSTSFGQNNSISLKIPTNFKKVRKNNLLAKKYYNSSISDTKLKKTSLNEDIQFENTSQKREETDSGVEETPKIIEELNITKFLTKDLYSTKLFKATLILYIFIILIFIGCVLYWNIVIVNNQHKIVSLGISLTDIINYIFLLSVIHKISLVKFDPFFTGEVIPQENYSDFLSENWYNIKPSLNSSSNVLMKGTLFDMLLYSITVTKQNIEIVTQNNDKETRAIQQAYSEFDTNEFCYISNYYYFRMFPQIKYVTFEEYVRTFSYSVTSCRILNPYFNNEGLSTTLSVTLNEMIYHYSLFMKEHKEGIRNQIDNFFKNEELMWMFFNMNSPLDKAEFVITIKIKEEMKKGVDYIVNYHKIILLIYAFVNVCCFVSTYVITIKMIKYYFILYAVVKALKNSMNVR